jgi:hypothetical protein
MRWKITLRGQGFKKVSAHREPAVRGLLVYDATQLSVRSRFTKTKVVLQSTKFRTALAKATVSQRYKSPEVTYQDIPRDKIPDPLTHSLKASAGSCHIAASPSTRRLHQLRPLGLQACILYISPTEARTPVQLSWLVHHVLSVTKHPFSGWGAQICSK